MNSGSQGREVSASMLLFVWALAIILLPLAGLLLAGTPIEPYFEFPPRTLYVTHTPFSWSAFVVVFLLLAVCVSLQLAGLKRVSYDRSVPIAHSRQPLIFVLLLLGIWIVAWQRFTFFSFLQEHTFFLIWGAYIALIHFTLRSLGRVSPFSGRPLKTVGLFFASAGFWWLYEWLNRFVQNWLYRNVEQYSPWEYFFLATLSFSTVLPATLATKELLGACLRIEVSESGCIKNLFSLLNRFWLWALPAAVLALVFVGRYPNELFPFLWLSPLIILRVSVQVSSRRSFLDLNSRQQFTDLYLWSLSGLWCGFLWELWNFKSLAGWSYLISYLDGFHLFEMPILGYGGYLPFGVLCGLVCALLGFEGSSNSQGNKSDLQTP